MFSKILASVSYSEIREKIKFNMHACMHACMYANKTVHSQLKSIESKLLQSTQSIELRMHAGSLESTREA